MKIIHALTGVILFVVLLAAGAALIGFAFCRGTPWDPTRCPVMSDPEALGRLGIGLLALALVHALSRFPSRRDAKYISFRSRSGSVHVSVEAARNFIVKIADEFAAILRMDPVLESRGRQLDVTLNLRVKAGTQIPELCDLLQQRVRESVSDSLGITDLRNVRVNITEIVGHPEPRSPDEELLSSVD
jgi:uncharacterized alkaline shock family protein YloU